MPTKAELEARVQELEHNVRRLDRALNQAQLDLGSESEQKRLVFHPIPHSSDRVHEALKRGQAEWELNVKDPSKRINAYIRTSEGIAWGWEKEYTKNGQFAWCGAFAAYCWGMSVKKTIRQKIFPSCYRLYSNWGSTSRSIDHDKMMPGDIVVVYSAKRAKQGDHITICVEPPSSCGDFKTVEGNAYGTLGDDSYGEGVIKRERNLNDVAHVYRLIADDFDQ
jgi:hypothetical protein